MKRTAALIMVVALLSMSLKSWAIDCSRKVSNIEAMICKSPEVALKDVILNEKYNLARSISLNRALLKSEQGEWLVKSRNKCAEISCLMQAYSKRISELEESINNTAKACTTQESTIIGTWIGVRDAEFESFELNKDHSFNSWRNDRPEYTGKVWNFNPKTCDLDIASGEDNSVFKYKIILTPDKKLITINPKPLESSVYKKYPK
ncbi:lysozyme inhibitor LprI family protein [Chromobacterium amazonense]|uniref:lysozyme inhibitor LprI family protein n=1 Tax=Chromobacterium amazonense TaxID=1382803 RepID=UPI001113AA5B|nr:hypothetical protein [Chromobacterium amazonense]